MRYCPNCRTAYTDDTLQFCLQDGTILVSDSPSAPVSGENLEEPATVVRQRASGGGQNQSGEIVSSPEQKKSNAFLVALTTFLATLLLVVGGIAAWYFLRNREPETATSLNANPRNSDSPKPSGANSSNNSAANTDTNRVNVINAASPTPAANANVNSTAKPTPEINDEQIVNEVSDKVDQWKNSFSDIDSHMSNYADRLDYYYNSCGTSAGAVRSDKQRAFDLYDEFDVRIKNLRVTPDESGQRATAVFDKEWRFESDARRNEGKVQSQLQLMKIGGRWQITGEKDLKVYYVENTK